jgi:hypothetical protein
MNSLWRYNSPSIYDNFDIYREEDELFIYDRRDLPGSITRWLSADEEDVVELDSML